MFCPQCGSNQSDELNFCKSCGGNLKAVRRAVTTRNASGTFDWNKTWIAEMMLSGEEAVKRAAEIERLKGITPETKRRNEIKAGVITASVGAGLMITLFVLMQAIVLNPRIPPEAAVILRSLWVAGVIPLLVGLALIVNGMFVSKKVPRANVHQTDDRTSELEDRANADFLPPAETSPLAHDIFSVTDETTKNLEEPVPVRSKHVKSE